LNKKIFKIIWPNNFISDAEEGEDWFLNAYKADLNIPSGCLVGRCGTCEIEVNGEVIRPCVENINDTYSHKLKVEFIQDPFW
tara:strand:- start:3267 stop:3512 length:246 start_codon:yes stop_codon:yes gene_type:complete